MVVTIHMERESHVRMPHTGNSRSHTGNMVPELMYSAVEIQSPREAFSVPP